MVPHGDTQTPQAHRPSWKDTSHVVLDILVQSVVLLQAAPLPGTPQSGIGPSRYRGFLMAARGENIPDPFIFAREHHGDFIIKSYTSSCYGVFTSPCIHHPEENGSV